MSQRRPLLLGVALVVGVSSAGCSGSDDPTKALLTKAEWKNEPGSPAGTPGPDWRVIFPLVIITHL